METPLPLPADATPKPKVQVLAEAIIPGAGNTHWHTRIQWMVIVMLAWQCPQLRAPLAYFFGGVPSGFASPAVARPAGRIVPLDPKTGHGVPAAPLAVVDPIEGRVLALSTNGGLTWTAGSAP